MMTQRCIWVAFSGDTQRAMCVCTQGHLFTFSHMDASSLCPGADGSLYIWGDGTYGQIGNNVSHSGSSPVECNRETNQMMEQRIACKSSTRGSNSFGLFFGTVCQFFQRFFKKTCQMFLDCFSTPPSFSVPIFLAFNFLAPIPPFIQFSLVAAYV